MVTGKRPKPIPQRTCVGCREVNAKRQLVRVVRGADHSVQIDLTGKARGRGAYVHAKRSCWQAALNGSTLAHALRIEISEADRVTLLAHGQTYSDDD